MTSAPQTTMLTALVPQAPVHKRQIDIPLEVIEHFLSFVNIDIKKTHLACSLTCRKWRAACMPFLFSSLSKGYSRRLIDLLALGQAHRSRDFVCSVRKLVVSEGIMTAKLFMTILKTFPKLRHLQLSFPIFELGPSWEVPAGHPTFELDALTIVKGFNDRYYRHDILPDLFRAFTRINTLTLEGAWRFSASAVRTFSVPLQVHNIAGAASVHLWLRLLRNTKTNVDQTLQSVQVHVESGGAEQVGQLLSAGGANVRSLHVYFGDALYDARPGDILKISSCRHLTHAIFDFSAMTGNYQTSWQFVWNLVSSLPPDSFTSLRFVELERLIVPDVRTGDESGLKGLQAALVPLHSLKEVTIASTSVTLRRSVEAYKSFVGRLMLPTETGYRLAFEDPRY
ncbi:hypothetical protein BDW22DRAFT_1432201 [Trametopsis cervina]|nr:hypothetical protein BDW22DRAFT_1432201 [Trametopsis cervina]